MVRTESRAGKVIRHETYVLARGGVAQFELRDEGSQRLVALVVTHAPAQEPDRAAPAARGPGLAGQRPSAAAGKTGRASPDDRRPSQQAVTRDDRGRGAGLPDRDHDRSAGPSSRSVWPSASSLEPRSAGFRPSWLAESGVQRALARLARDRDYPARRGRCGAAISARPNRRRQALAPPHAEPPAAVVTIAVEQTCRRLGSRRLRVQADYPPDPPRRSRHSKQIMIDLEPSPEEPPHDPRGCRSIVPELARLGPSAGAPRRSP